MFYLYLALTAQILNALVVLLDKYLISSKSVPKPRVYAFYITMLSGAVVLILPFGLVLAPTVRIVWLSLAVAFTYTFSILFLYRALAISDASDAAPAVGAVSALSTLLFSFLILGNSLADNFLYGFIFLVLGTVLMSYFRFSRRALLCVVISGILFGLSSVLVKLVFSETTFWNGFFWSRIGNVVAGLSFFFWPGTRKLIFENVIKSKTHTKVLILGNKVLAGLAFLLLLLAIKLGNVSIVNAISGMQFVILIIFALIFAKKFPNYFYESVHRKITVIQKVIAVLIISFGYFILFA